MKKFRYTDSQILAIPKQKEEDTKVPDLCSEHGMSDATFYKVRGCVADEAHEGALGGESSAQENVCRRANQI